jgi:hypothetical protein
MRRGAGCGGRCMRQDVARAAEAQAAMIRLTGRGSPAEDTKKVRPAMPVNGVCPPGLSQSKPHTPRAERRRFRRSVVTAISCAYSLRAWGHGLAESPAFRAPLGFQGQVAANGIRARPRRLKNQGRRSLACSVIARTARRSRSRTRQSMAIDPRGRCVDCFAALAMTR